MRILSWALASTLLLETALWAAPVPPAKIPVVFAKPAMVSELFEVLTYPARVVPRVHANVLSESDGIVTRISSPLGARVGRRQSLMVVRNTDPVYQYAPVQVLAPVAGVVSQVEVTEGSRVVRGQRLAVVTDPAQIRTVVEIAAQDLSSIRPGMNADLRLNGQEISRGLRVRGVSPFVDPATGTATCELELTTAKGPLVSPPVPPGSVGQVVFMVNRHTGITIPEHAIMYRGKETFLRVVVSGKSRQVPVSLGRKQKGFVEILSGAKAGDQIVERTSGYVGDGETVKVESSGGDDDHAQSL